MADGHNGSPGESKKMSTAVVSSASTLSNDPAAEINQLYDLATASGREMVKFMIQCGGKLCAQKKLVKHGQWGSWLEQNCKFSAVTAQTYMRLYELKTQGLCFSSASEMWAYLRGEKVSPPPREKYLDFDTPDFELPPGYNVDDWSYSHQTAKRLRPLASALKFIDPQKVARGTLPDEQDKLMSSVKQIQWFMDELRGALQLRRLGVEQTEPTKQPPNTENLPPVE